MNKSFLSTFCWGCFIIAALLFAVGAAPLKQSKSKKTTSADRLFDSAEVLQIDIDIPTVSVAKLQKYQWQFGPQSERENVKVTVREGGLIFTNVALHLKGSAGSFRPITDNPALTLHFDKFLEGQHFHGLSKISLNNSVQDPSLISEQFSREMFLKAGVPVPRVTHALVRINGRDLGLYVLVEGFNKQFIKRHFKDAGGNLYDGGFIKDVTDELAVNAGDNPKDQSDRIALAEAAAEPNLTNRQARLEKVLDMDHFLSFLAMDVMLWDWDGYGMNKNNWRLFHDRSTGKMFFIPHGLDQMFWKPEGSILPPMKGLVANAVLQIPELRTRYFARIKELRATVFKAEVMTNRVQEIAAEITPALKEKKPDSVKDQAKAVADFCDAIARRCQSLDQQLSVPIIPVKFDDSGSATLSHWEPVTEFGHPVTIREPNQDGKESLRVGTVAGSSIGSWRSKMWLEKGQYQIEGRVKTQGIVADLGDSRGGSGFRLAKSRPEKYLQATSDWTTLKQEFSINDPLAEVELLCEFRGAEGDAWFDAQSLKLRRLPPNTK